MTWILPKNLHTLACATDTEELTLGCSSLSGLTGSGLSLFARSKPLQSKTLWQKWNRGELNRLRSGLILRPSHGKAFGERWTSCLVATLASHSVQQGNGSEPKIQDTSGPVSQMEFAFVSQDSVSSKMSKDTSRWDSPQSSAIWKKWVTKCRGEYSARLKSAHPTNESGCLSWPTVTVNESKNSEGKSQWGRNTPPLGTIVHGHPDRAKINKSGKSQESCKNWPTPDASDRRSDLSKQKRLNPRWVAQLMGLSPDWVYPSETERNRTDELRMLGNGVVPQTAAKAFVTLLSAMEANQ